MFMITLVERALQPLDGVRGIVLRALCHVAPLRRTLAARETRIPILLTGHACIAFGLALFVPSLSLVLAPLLLGIPHVASDVRYLVLRRGLPRWCLQGVWAFAVLLLLLRLLEESRVLRTPPLVAENLVGAAWIVAGALGGVATGGWRRTSAPVLGCALAIAVASLAAPRAFRLAFLHGHNLVAIAIWLLLFWRVARACVLPLALILVGAAVLASGRLLGITVHDGALSVLGLHLFSAADWIAPGLSDRRALGLTVSFAFLQSIHYAIWLVAIPQSDARRSGGATFRMTWRGLRRDFGGPALWIIVGVAAGVAGAGAASPMRSRTVFLSLATFHAWLELALLAFLVGRDGLASRHAPRTGT